MALRRGLRPKNWLPKEEGREMAASVTAQHPSSATRLRIRGLEVRLERSDDDKGRRRGRIPPGAKVGVGAGAAAARVACRRLPSVGAMAV